MKNSSQRHTKLSISLPATLHLKLRLVAQHKRVKLSAIVCQILHNMDFPEILEEPYRTLLGKLDS